jgi:hypothetical protein
MNFVFHFDVWDDNIEQGETGTISLITHIGTGIKVVWKKVRVIKGKEGKTMEEVNISKSFNSPYLVPVLDSFVDDGKL